MRGARLAGWLALGTVGLVLGAAGAAQAATESVDSPAGTAYVTYGFSIEEPETRGDRICIPLRGCYVMDPVHVDDPGGADARSSVWLEDNGCEGLQRSTSDCDGDGETEPADERVTGLSPSLHP